MESVDAHAFLLIMLMAEGAVLMISMILVILKKRKEEAGDSSKHRKAVVKRNRTRCLKEAAIKALQLHTLLKGSCYKSITTTHPAQRKLL
ncbi:hypothetical protein HDV63DRAFT_375202 [Trichoderma sp. SZMC 28014]